ncbi:YbaN family protein [Bdellovibrio bacteriovorus]
MQILNSTKKFIFFVFGWIFLALGVIGIFLPLLPTTPFLLLTAFCFSRSSDRWHQWLLRQPHLGQLIVDWERHGVIRIKAKLLSTGIMVPLVAYSLSKPHIPIYGKVSAAVICLGVLVFIWSRPSSIKP